jgi:hypothetical protein
MAELLTLDAFLKATETELPLSPRLAALLGRPAMRFMGIDSGRFGALFPIMPPEVAATPLNKDGKPDPTAPTLSERERRWLMTLPAEERIRYRLEVENVRFHVIALTALEPRLTFEQALRLGSDADALYLAVLRFSGLLEDAKTQAPLTEPAADPADSPIAPIRSDALEPVHA